MTNLVDRYLLYRIRTHQDSQAFARIYDRYVASIYRFVLLKLPSKEDAEDLTSDTFLKCWRYMQEHHNVKDIRALLYQIARNAVVDWYRQRALSPRTLAVTFQAAETSSFVQQEISDSGKSSVVMEARAELSLVMGKLERLKDEYRDVLAMRLIDGLPFAIIAEILGKTAGNVRVVYHRAKKALDALDQQP